MKKIFVRVVNKMSLTHVEQGTLEGVVCDNGKYVAFKGIPYAKPPLGKLRFKAPEPPETWDGIRNANEHGPICPQYNERMNRIEDGSEDCLYLNVYSKNLKPTTPLPVMVWIHGGGFYTGSGNSEFYGPDFFMEHEVILVTLNYRLEVLGFLCLDNEEVPGNAGLKDQVAALKWIKQNIAAFGGDKNNITLFGCSAGSASTSLHLVSDMSKGLFDKAICQSGVCLNEWAYNLYARERAFQLGKLLGKETEDEIELLEFLRSIPASSLVNNELPYLQINNIDLVDNIKFGPVIENPNLNVEKFLNESPVNLVKKGHLANIPLILGYTSGEGIEIVRNLPRIVNYYSMVGSVVPRELKLKLQLEDIKELDVKIRKHYCGGKEITQDMYQELVDLETDRLFVYNIIRYARYHNHHNSKPVFLYKFTAETERNYTKRNYNMNTVKGVCHSDDLMYFFNVTCLDIPLTQESKDIIDKLVRLWVNFAKTGCPVSERESEQWRPFTNSEKNTYIIGNNFKSVQDEDDENIRFWDEIYNENI